MTGPRITPDIIAAAEFERDQRATKFPKLIAEQKTAPLFAHLDWQSWAAVADWLRHGRSDHVGAWGGTDQKPRILNWQTIHIHVEKGRRQIDQLHRKHAGDPQTPPDALDGIARRRDALAVIEYVVRCRRDLANATLRLVDQRRQPEEKAA